MPVWLKIILFLGGVAVLGVAAIGGVGWYWWHRNGDGVLEKSRLAMAEGDQAAKSTDQGGCLAAAFARGPGCATIACNVDRNLFLTNCAGKAKKTPGFCAGVPRTSELMASVVYRYRECARHRGMADTACQQVYAAMQNVCDAQ